jgi:hypothetical protein
LQNLAALVIRRAIVCLGPLLSRTNLFPSGQKPLQKQRPREGEAINMRRKNFNLLMSFGVRKKRSSSARDLVRFRLNAFGAVVQTEFVAFLPSVPPFGRFALHYFSLGLLGHGPVVPTDMVRQSTSRKPFAADRTGIAVIIPHHVRVPYLHCRPFASANARGNAAYVTSP